MVWFGRKGGSEEVWIKLDWIGLDWIRGGVGLGTKKGGDDDDDDDDEVGQVEVSEGCRVAVVTMWVGVTELGVVRERYGWKLAGVQDAQGICQGVRKRERERERVKRKWRFDSKY